MHGARVHWADDPRRSAPRARVDRSIPLRASWPRDRGDALGSSPGERAESVTAAPRGASSIFRFRRRSLRDSGRVGFHVSTRDGFAAPISSIDLAVADSLSHPSPHLLGRPQMRNDSKAVAARDVDKASRGENVYVVATLQVVGIVRDRCNPSRRLCGKVTAIVFQQADREKTDSDRTRVVVVDPMHTSVQRPTPFDLSLMLMVPPRHVLAALGPPCAGAHEVWPTAVVRHLRGRVDELRRLPKCNAIAIESTRDRRVLRRLFRRLPST